MLIKLTIKNIRQSVRDYSVYFLTLVLAITLFYVFNAIGDQSSILNASENQKSILEGLTSITNILSVFIAFVLGFLILYANQFLIKRRSKELGIYLLLGMKRSKVAMIFLLETLIIGVFSLIIGLVLGFYGSQGMGLLAGKLLSIPVGTFRFVFSPLAFVLTLVCFSLMFVVVALFNTISLRRLRLISLIQASRRVTNVKPRSVVMTILIFLFSSVLLVLAYVAIIQSRFNPTSFLFLPSILLGSVGTYFFFEGISGFFVQLIKAFPKIYYSRLNMVTVRLVNSRLRVTKWLMSVVCILLLLTIGALSSGFNISESIRSLSDQPVPAVMIYDAPQDMSDDENPLMNGQVDPLIQKRADTLLYETELSAQSLREQGFTINLPPEGEDYFSIKAISHSDYAELVTYYELEQAPLDTSSAYTMLSVDKPELVQVPERFEIGIKEATVQGHGTTIPNVNVNLSPNDWITLVLPDEVITSLSEITALVYLEPKEGSLTELKDVLTDYQGFIQYSEDLTEQMFSLSGISIFITLYLGLIFLVTALALLALQQLSESQDNKHNYQILRKLGTPREWINRSIFHQLLFYFLIPLALALVHSYFGLKATETLLTIFGFGEGSPVTAALPVTGIILSMYLIYLVSTYFNAKRIVEK